MFLDRPRGEQRSGRGHKCNYETCLNCEQIAPTVDADTFVFLFIINNYIAANAIIGKHIIYASVKGLSIVLGPASISAWSSSSQEGC